MRTKLPKKCDENEFNPPRLDYLDGLRGLAALYVVLGHSYLELLYNHEHVTPALASWFYLLRFNRLSVSIFIVLSGYCLMLPLAHKSQFQFRGGLLEFARRRALRILPAYYGALVASLLVAFCCPALMRPVGLWRDSIPIDPMAILSHFLLVHNFSPLWYHKINYPLWSIATEWQIYFVFALLLVPMARKFGTPKSLMAAAMLGYGPHFLFNGFGDWAAPWYLFLFMLGASSACVADPTCQILNSKRLRALPWGKCSLLFVCALIFWYRATRSTVRSDHSILFDTLVGCAFACFLICLRSNTAAVIHLRSVLGSVYGRALGRVSYSLYLIHALVLLSVASFVRAYTENGDTRFLLIMLVTAPLSLVTAWLFSLVFERPFEKMKQKHFWSNESEPAESENISSIQTRNIDLSASAGP